MSDLQPHLKLKAGDVAPNLITGGDPGRMKYIAENFFDSYKEVVFNREYRTFTGEYKGMPISATSHGIGCPGAAIAIEELANVGVKNIIRVGTCGGLRRDSEAGDLLIPTAAMRCEGTTREYIGKEFPAIADLDLTSHLIRTAKKLGKRYQVGINRTHDGFYEHQDNLIKWGNIYRDQRMKNWKYPLISSEMEASTVFLISHLRGMRAACILVNVSPEPLDMIVEDPSLIYKIDEGGKKVGVDEAVEVALEAMLSFVNDEDRLVD